MSSQKVIVTGGAGFIGSQLVRLLKDNGFKVIVYDDFSNGSGKNNLPSSISIIKGSIGHKFRRRHFPVHHVVGLSSQSNPDPIEWLCSRGHGLAGDRFLAGRPDHFVRGTTTV